MKRVLAAFGKAALCYLFLLGLMAPLWVVLVLIIFPQAAVSPDPYEASRFPRAGLLLVFLAIACGIGVLHVPLRSGIQAALFAFERHGGIVDPWWRSVLVTPWLDTFLGACGVVFSLIVLAGVRSTWTKLKHVQNIPTSRARSAAAGLVELHGIARATPEGPRARDLKTGGPRLDWNAIVPAGTLVYKDSQPGDGDSMRQATCKLTSRFFLEDTTGRILIDPRGADFHDFSFLYELGEPPARLALSRNRLMEGDAVYVLGTVEVRPDAPPLASDSERLVVSALPARHRSAGAAVSSLAWLTDPFSRRRSHVFLLSDTPESGLQLALEKSLYDTFAFGFVLFVASLWLFLVHAPSLAR